MALFRNETNYPFWDNPETKEKVNWVRGNNNTWSLLLHLAGSATDENVLKPEINYDSPRGGVSVITEKGDITVSYLLVQRAKDSDSGKYTCNPSNANPKTLIVHVLNGEHPAAMQHGGQLRLEYPFSACLLSILVALVGP
ncbi:unnamed protein product [Brassicogethes aeneus]|uniref:Ig-like domain-containing protein n=1 Tax=Brassicogethes aeneus TaxID=1431903 RepID=A0A9P0AWS9_BRAAE|nr:unnamed protein product [Brassicogethes aeneus]